MSEIEKGLKRICVTISKPVLADSYHIRHTCDIISRPVARIVGLYFIIQGLLFFADYFELRKG